MTESDSKTTHGVGPHPLPWPTDDKYDQELLANGDTRNVIDKYRYWKNEAIVEDLNKQRTSLHVAIENLEHDFNIGTIVRNANAFNVSTVHIIGRKQWNKRGAMVTNRYLNILHHPTIEDFLNSLPQGYEVIAIDNQEGSVEMSKFSFPEKTCLVFGGEGPGISKELNAQAKAMVRIEQFGSTRSVNVGVASGITMYQWMLQYVLK